MPVFAGGSSTGVVEVGGVAGAAGAAGSAEVSSAGGLLAGELMMLHGVVLRVGYRQGRTRGIVTELEGMQPPQSQIKSTLPKDEQVLGA